MPTNSSSRASGISVTGSTERSNIRAQDPEEKRVQGMNGEPTKQTRKPVAVERRAQPRDANGKWRTALPSNEPNKILVRGYPLGEIMGRWTFGEAIYLLLLGECPSPGIGRLMEAILVSFIDHGATPPSTLAARNTATTGAARLRERWRGAMRGPRGHRPGRASPRACWGSGGITAATSRAAWNFSTPA